MAKSILHFRQITLDGLSQQNQRKIFRAPKTKWGPPTSENTKQLIYEINIEVM